MKGCELELVQKVKKIGCYREPKPRLKMLGANSYKAGWGIGRVTALDGDVHTIVHWETELSGASRHLMELGLRRKSSKDLSSLAPPSDL